ncbi:MAG: 5-(carboxyamino)imidazole ribonucleotide synthase [Phycisphaerae bacterium]|nr:5-(carboxyamino)imidazole ribonucleotide synthase [Phycisphaerae bacterium]
MNVGVLGSGQLGRMLGLAGLPLGVQSRFFDRAGGQMNGSGQAEALPAPAAAAGPCTLGSFEDEDALCRWAQGLDAVTYEFENVPVGAARVVATVAPVWPPPAALEVSQDRIAEKTLFNRLGIPTPVFAAVDNLADLEEGLARTGLPAVLKTRRGGYDGKGQVVLREPQQAAWALGAVAPQRRSGEAADLIVEQMVPFQRELSILAARGADGACAFYPLVENEHGAGILRLSVAPARGLNAAVQGLAQEYARRVLQELAYVGVMALELFEMPSGLLANEMAPRVHNSGHWTIEGAATSQFENHVRTVVGWPLGAASMRPARGAGAMLNLIGSAPDTRALLALPDTHVHLYGKTPRPGRKLGHVTIVASDHGALESRLAAARALIVASAT